MIYFLYLFCFLFLCLFFLLAVPVLFLSCKSVGGVAVSLPCFPWNAAKETHLNCIMIMQHSIIFRSQLQSFAWLSHHFHPHFLFVFFFFLFHNYLVGFHVSCNLLKLFVSNSSFLKSPVINSRVSHLLLLSPAEKNLWVLFPLSCWTVF